MCLSTILKNPIKATEEIPVYKVIDQEDTAPFFGSYSYHHGYNTAHNPRQVEEDPDYPGTYDIFGGFLHAYLSKPLAIECAAELNESVKTPGALGYGKKYRVVNMYVPVGAEYYIDRFSEEICSEKLLWREEETVVSKDIIDHCLKDFPFIKEQRLSFY